MSESPQNFLQPEGRVLPTLEADGSRRWLTPRLSKGTFWNARRWVAYFLIAIFTIVPFIKVYGKPAILIDLPRRQLTLLGYTFLPTDTILLALLLVTWILSIFLVTAMLGRVWCGWACPQTVYMEFLYRPIERLCLGRKGQGGKPKADTAMWRYAIMYLLFLAASLFVAHTALSYFVGVEELRRWMTHSPAEHPSSFVIIVLVTGLMMFDFVYFREQTCLIACPYGRFQSVLHDRNTMTVRYDKTRGEPRGRATKATRSLPVIADPAARAQGDCVDCDMCVQVCPTGIDIRDGMQFECIACTQCIDACDTVMTKLKRPTGLIRYVSESVLGGAPKKFIRPRVIIYLLGVTALFTLLVFLTVTKPPIDVLLLRNGGMPFMIALDGRAENTIRLKLTNRSDVPQTIYVTTEGVDGVEIIEGKDPIKLQPGEMSTTPMHLRADRSIFQRGKRDIQLKIYSEAGWSRVKPFELFGPGTASQTSKP